MSTPLILPEAGGLRLSTAMAYGQTAKVVSRPYESNGEVWLFSPYS